MQVALTVEVKRTFVIELSFTEGAALLGELRGLLCAPVTDQIKQELQKLLTADVKTLDTPVS